MATNTSNPLKSYISIIHLKGPTNIHNPLESNSNIQSFRKTFIYIIFLKEEHIQSFRTIK